MVALMLRLRRNGKVGRWWASELGMCGRWCGRRWCGHRHGVKSVFSAHADAENRAQHASTAMDGARAAALFTIGAVLVVMEFSTVLLCVANDYKAFNYALRIADVDAARQLDLETLWASGAAADPSVWPEQHRAPPREPPPAPQQRNPFVARRRVPAPRRLLRASFEEMIDWHLAVDTSDSFVLLLLFVSTVYCALFLNTTHLLRTEDMLDKVIASPPRGDVLLLDVVFWALFASDFACLQKLANLVCVDALIAGPRSCTRCSCLCSRKWTRRRRPWASASASCGTCTLSRCWPRAACRCCRGWPWCPCISWQWGWCLCTGQVRP